LCFVFSLISPVFFMFSLLFSVSNFYFTSQYHQFPPPPPPPRWISTKNTKKCKQKP
jgi:hypothetical protein